MEGRHILDGLWHIMAGSPGSHMSPAPWMVHRSGGSGAPASPPCLPRPTIGRPMALGVRFRDGGRRCRAKLGGQSPQDGPQAKVCRRQGQVRSTSPHIGRTRGRCRLVGQTSGNQSFEIHMMPRKDITGPPVPHGAGPGRLPNAAAGGAVLAHRALREEPRHDHMGRVVEALDAGDDRREPGHARAHHKTKTASHGPFRIVFRTWFPCPSSRAAIPYSGLRVGLVVLEVPGASLRSNLGVTRCPPPGARNSRVGPRTNPYCAAIFRASTRGPGSMPLLRDQQLLLVSGRPAYLAGSSLSRRQRVT